jgi:hypothetical protein
MAGRRLWILASVAIVWAGWGCSGDDIELAPSDAGSHDAARAPFDAATPGVDAGIDSGCVLFDAAGLDPNAIDAGRLLVTASKCQQCHGGNLSGNNNGVQAPWGGTAYPPNLTGDPATGLGCWTNDEIARAILTGVDDQGMPLCPPMPHFGDAGMDAAAAQDIVDYLRSLHAVVNQVPNTDCSNIPDAAPSDGASDAPPPVDAATDATMVDAGIDASSQDAAADAPSADGGAVTDAAPADAADDTGSSDGSVE